MTYPLWSIVYKPNLAGRLALWEIELSEHDIWYVPQTTIESQMLADLIAEFTVGFEKAHKEA